jgi:pimeloyl-ACP methyl ester carboxylesterase
MPTVQANGVNLYYEATGDGFPLVFSHEFAGDYRSWEPQVRFFSRRYKVITYNHRGYPPSEVPTDPTAYSQDILVEDLYQLLGYLNISKAHIAGLSMGANVALNVGLRHPHVCASLVVAGCGSGSANREQFKQDAQVMIERLQKEGMEGVLDLIAFGPSRLQLRKKDLRVWQGFREQLLGHSALGSAFTFAGVQLRRPTIFELEAGLGELLVPVLLLVGDEDEPCIEPTIFMKRHIPRAGLLTFPQSGHAINLEEPDLFNRVMLDFLTTVEAGKWT